MTWERKLAAVFFFAVLLLALSTCFGATASEAAFRAVMCPPNWRATVAQRYDTRDRFGWIVKRTWITRCA